MNSLMKVFTVGGLALASGTTLAAGPAPSEAGTYWGVNVGQVNYSETGFPHFNPTAFLVSLGWEFSRNLAVEARVGTGIGSDSKVVSGLPISLKVKSFYGGYLRGTLPVSNAFSFYALAGYGRGELEASAMGTSVSTTDGAFSGGLGGEFALGSTSSIGLEYARMFSGSGYTANLISIGYRMRF
jgi:hypothetical protein